MSAGSLIYALALVVGVGISLPSSAAALEHPFLETFGSANEPTFTEAEGLVIDQVTGDLLVSDAGNRGPGEGTVSRWNPDGTPAKFSALGTNIIEGLQFNFPEETQIAVDDSGGATDGNIYITQPQQNRIDVFASDGSALGQLTEYQEGPLGAGSAKPLKEPCGVAVGPDGSVYVGEFFGSENIHKYEPATNLVQSSDTVANFSFATTCTLAAGAGTTDGFIFPAHLNASVAKLDSATGEQKYEVDPGPTATVTVDPATGTLYTASGNEVREFDVSGEAESVAGLPIVPEEEEVTGIAVDETTGNVYIARKDNPNIEVWGPAVQLPIAITESASVVNGTVTMLGVVNANGGPEASCEFQYAEVSPKGFEDAKSEPCSPAGPFTGTTNEVVRAEVSVSGLPEATYRYRLVAKNEDGSKAGEELFFDTLEKAPGLPDGRTYEMVSPPQKAGEVIPPEPGTQLGGSCGDCLPGITSPIMPMQSTASGEAVLYLGQPFTGGLAPGPNEYLASRGPQGWGTESLSAPTITGAYKAFSDDLARGVLAQADPRLSPRAPTRGGKAFPNLYLREDGGLKPLITGEPPNREPGDFQALFDVANAGTALMPPFGHLTFEANDALTKALPGIAPAAPDVAVGKNCGLPGANCNLYEWEGGELRLVNVLPDNENAAAGATIGAGRLLLLGVPQSQLPANVGQAISEDGSRIFWSAEETGHVYVRVEGKETLEIPGPGTCKESVTVKDRACFLTASADGSAVLLSDGQLFELNKAGSAYVATVDLSEGKGGFEGILGAAKDLSRIYLVDTEELPGASEANENGEQAEAGKPNLYAWDEGELGFIGGLLPGDNGFGVVGYGAWAASPAQRTAQVSSDGSQLAFMSLARLTDYDNRLRGGGNCNNVSVCREVFTYAADSEILSCVSCNPTGERPLGDSNLSLITPAGPFRQPGNVSHDGSGRLFFESQDKLSPRDTNGHIQDVYEWEPNGVGSCKRAAGCVYLISSGNSPNDSMFLDSSESGNDAFLITRESLLPRDQDEQLDLYDARVGGGFPEPGTSPCGVEACKGPIATPPVQPSAGSAIFSGPGNAQPKAKPCKPGYVKKHGKCVKKKPKKKKRSSRHSRGGSK